VAFNRKPSEQSASIATTEDALRVEGPLGRVESEAFEKQLNDPAVRDSLEAARRTWKKLYGRDPAPSRSSGNR
jgi:hypothetical protein